MPEVLFYHLERARLEQVLPDLLEKSLERGWKALVVSRSQDSQEHIDEALWTFRDDSFLPHASLNASEYPASEPVLLAHLEGTQPLASPNDAHVLFLVTGAVVPPEAMQSFERSVVIFDGRDEEALASARGFWKAIRDADDALGFQPTYWRQAGNGRWEKQG